jgi:N-methylhydantoinase B
MTTTRSERATDPITLEIIQSSLQAISDEMFAACRKTVMRAIIYGVLDMGTGITDGEGNLASSGAGIPAFVGVLDKAVQRIIELNDADEIWPGDIFVTNDPFYGGVTHLNDVVLAMPVFADGELISWTANIAHWNDRGMVPGSSRTGARSSGGPAAAGHEARLGRRADPLGDGIMKVNRAGRHVGRHRRSPRG